MDETNDFVYEEALWTKYQDYEDVYKIELNTNTVVFAQKRFSKLLAHRFAYEEDLRELSLQIFDHFRATHETSEDYEDKMSSMHEIDRIIRKNKRWRFKLFPTGSTVTNLASKGSDLDVTIWVPYARKYFADESEAAFNVLRNVRHFLFIDQEISHKLESVLYVEAKGGYLVLNLIFMIPVLKIKWKKGLEVDLSCSMENFVSGIQNSYLIRGFSLWDTRFAPLCVLVKDWASQNDVKNPKHGGFNSYALVLLVVHFLQCAVFPPILPNLQELFPGKFAQNCDGVIHYPCELDFGERMFPNDHPVLEKNKMSLAELFIRFLDYYTTFEFENHYICMRSAAVRLRNGLESQRISDAITVFIRDPIDDHNPARTVRDVDYLQNRMRRTLQLFMASGKFPSLSEILKNH